MNIAIQLFETIDICAGNCKGRRRYDTVLCLLQPELWPQVEGLRSHSSYGGCTVLDLVEKLILNHKENSATVHCLVYVQCNESHPVLAWKTCYY